MPRPPISVPPLPHTFLARPVPLDGLVKVLLRNQGGQSETIALTAVAGMGGIGKTVLAQALCRDERIRQAFPDGIFWQSIGKTTLDYSYFAHLLIIPLAFLIAALLSIAYVDNRLTISAAFVIVLLDSYGRLTRVGDANRVKYWLETGEAQPPVVAIKAGTRSKRAKAIPARV